MDDVKYPNVHVKLVGENGNAFNIIGLVSRAMRRAGCPAEAISEFQREAMSGDYDHVLVTAMRTVDVE